MSTMFIFGDNMKNSILAGLFSICLFISPSALADKAEPICIYFEALTLFQQEKFGEGLKKYYKYLLFSDPILSVECRKNDLQEAKAFFDHRSRLAPKDPQTQLYLSLCDRIILNCASASSQLDTLLAKYQKSSILNFFSGEFYLVQEKNAEAIHAFSKLKNKDGSKFWVLAQILEKKYGVNGDQIERKSALLRKGLRHLDLFENEQAEKILRQVMTEYPDDPRAPQELMDHFINENRLKEAEKILIEWRKNAPGGKALHFPEARLMFRLGRFTEVLRILTPVLSADPGNEYLQSLVAESLFMNGEYRKALGFLTSLQEADPLNLGLLLRRTASLELTGQASDAISLVTTLLEKAPKNAPLRVELGGIYERMGNLQNAREAYELVVNEESPLKALAQKRLEIFRQQKTKEQNNSDTILATMFLGGKMTEKEPPAVQEKLPPPLLERIMQEQKEILDALSQN
ncbi:MAG TPA: tetratricopeptide repeat protein [Candidatus Ozemobacteraceae bacterium]|nr:tetratricopeptide repeat protein [Candidatus Ozemobacteraceae bacterium]